MTHKIVEVRKGSPYTGTTVPFHRSMQQIIDMLEKRGCGKILEARDYDGQHPLHTLAFEHHGISYIIEFPVTHVFTKGGSRNLNMNVSGRIIHDRVKALLIAVDIDYLDFSRAMMEYLAVKGPECQGGRPVPLSEMVGYCGEQFLQGGFDLRMCLPGGDR